jgi:hypothetical protein
MFKLFYRLQEACWEVKRQLKNFFWFGWRMRKVFPWDHTLLYEALDVSLKALLKSHQHYIDIEWVYLGANKEMKSMRLCRALLKRIIKDDYNTPFTDFYNSTYHIDDVEEQLSDILGPPDRSKKTKISKRRFDANFKLMNQHYINSRNTDLDLLFSTLRKHSDKWWN